MIFILNFSYVLSALLVKNIHRRISSICFLFAVKIMIQCPDEPFYPQFLPTPTRWGVSQGDKEGPHYSFIHNIMFCMVDRFLIINWNSLFLESELLKFIPCCDNQFAIYEDWFSCRLLHCGSLLSITIIIRSYNSGNISSSNHLQISFRINWVLIW